MAVSSEVRSAGPFLGDGTTRTFTFSFKIFDASQVKVLTSTDGGDTETEVDDALYSVSLNDEQDVLNILINTSGFSFKKTASS